MTPERWRHITEVFHAALKLGAADRQAFVASRCGDDEALRSAVASMVAAHEAVSQLGESAVFSGARLADAESSRSAMVFTPGDRVGPFHVDRLIGVGGMGAVYRARDTRLHRDVALKVLLPAIAHDADHAARFRREAQALASLNHSNVAQIYGLEESGGICTLVMELVEGATLADRIAHGAIPVDEALAVAKQIAEALEAAHEHGIVHRDLKPANIKLGPDGTIKVLDFGLARLLHPSPEQAEPNATISPASLTSAGVILGTVAYMAPEQAKGKPADRRADMWAFACVLFEMLTAQRAFPGGTFADVSARIIEHDPDWMSLPARTPEAIRRLLRRCLEKDPKRRLDSAAVARIEIDEAAKEPSRSVPSAGTRRGSFWRAAMWATTGAIVAALLTMVVATLTRRSEVPPALVATSISVDGGVSLDQPGIHFAVAPNGRTVVYSGASGADTVLYRRDLDRLDPVPITGTEGGSDEFFSGNGRSIGFETNSELWTASIDGGVMLTGLMPGTPVEDLLFVPLAGDKRLQVLFHASGVERNVAIAPNGRFIAYDSDDSRSPQVYVRPFPNVGARKWQISTEVGIGPVWTRGGSEIVYKDPQAG